MKPSSISPQQYELLSRLSSLPKHILALHSSDRLVEMVLGELCDARCFNLKKAAYFIDNPDFDCCRGVAGFNADDHATRPSRLWEAQEAFAQAMEKSAFHRLVKGVQHASITRNNAEVLVNALAQQLNLVRPAFYAFPIKHDNKGVIIFEANEPVHNELFDYGVSLLGFCPVF